MVEVGIFVDFFSPTHFKWREKFLFEGSQTNRMAEVERDLWMSSSSTPAPISCTT